MIKISLITLIIYAFSSILAYAQSKDIDIESLGLDNVNKKSELALPVIPINKVISDKAKKEKIAQKDVKKTKKTPKIVKKDVKIAKKTQKTVKNTIKKSNNVPILKTKDGKIIKVSKIAPKSAIKTPISPKKEENTALIESEKLEKTRIEELEKLRKKYLITSPKKSLSEKIILPQRKVVNPFISEELPAPPILDGYRTQDNIHIPTFLSLDKRIKNLFETISQGDVAFFNSAYQDVKNPNIRNDLGDTLLTYSLLTQQHAIAASLISKGADVNIPNKLGYTPMDIVIELKDLQNFELLINNKANIHFVDKFGRTYLFHAARLGFLSAVEALVRRGIDMNAIDKDGFSALDIAYKNKRELIVQYLLKNGAKTWIEKPFDPTNKSLIKKLENRWGDNFKNSRY